MMRSRFSLVTKKSREATPEEKEAARMEAAKKVADAQAMAVERAEACKRKGKEEEPTQTQLGDNDLADDELEDLLKKVPLWQKNQKQRKANGAKTTRNEKHS